MDLKAAMEYLVGLSKPEISIVSGMPFSDRTLKPVLDPKIETIFVHDLTALVEFVQAQQPPDGYSPLCAVHVVDNCMVSLIIPHVGAFGRTQTYLTAAASCSDLSTVTGTYMPVDEFIIALNTLFVKGADDHHALVCEAVSNLAADAEIVNTDDGFSQTVTTKAGIRRVGRVDLPNPVELSPYMTFPEIGQPKCKFLLRIERRGSDITARLHPVQEPGWVAKCVNDIKSWLRGQGKMPLPVF